MSSLNFKFIFYRWDYTSLHSGKFSLNDSVVFYAREFCHFHRSFHMLARMLTRHVSKFEISSICRVCRVFKINHVMLTLVRKSIFWLRYDNVGYLSAVSFTPADVKVSSVEGGKIEKKINFQFFHTISFFCCTLRHSCHEKNFFSRRRCWWIEVERMRGAGNQRCWRIEFNFMPILARRRKKKTARKVWKYFFFIFSILFPFSFRLYESWYDLLILILSCINAEFSSSYNIHHLMITMMEISEFSLRILWRCEKVSTLKISKLTYERWWGAVKNDENMENYMRQSTR